MAWVRVSDDFYDHPRFAMLTAPGIALWLMGLAWSNRNLTDGRIPASIPARLLPEEWKTGRDELLEAGLWEEAEKGYQVRDYGDYQKTREQIEGLASKRSEAGRRGAQRRWQTEGKTGGKTPSSANSHPDGNSMANAMATGMGGSRSNEYRQASPRHVNTEVVPEPLDTPSDTPHAMANAMATGKQNDAPNPNPKEITTKKTSPLAPLAALVDVDDVAPKPEPAPDRFAEFYAVYPRRVDRRKAEQAWKAALKRGATPDRLIEAAERYAQTKQGSDPKYVKYPASWLNAGAYDDEPDQAPPLQLVSGGYQPFRNPTDDSIYDAPFFQEDQ
jgi:hypothetical protein